jgi:hypothetical protein
MVSHPATNSENIFRLRGDGLDRRSGPVVYITPHGKRAEINTSGMEPVVTGENTWASMRVNGQGLRILMPVIKERRDNPGLCLQRMGLGKARFNSGSCSTYHYYCSFVGHPVLVCLDMIR